MTTALIIRETMSGWLKLDADGREQDFAFSIRAVGEKLFALTAPRPFTGTVTLDGRDYPCEGEMTIRLTGPHYWLDFEHPELGPLRVEGNKTYGKNGLLRSLITCPLTVYRQGEPIGAAQVTYREPMLTFPFTALRLELVGPVFPAGSIPYYGNQYGGQGGHYESWFLRANHPDRPLAFWVRYTQFIPADKRAALGEIWGIWFDGEKNTVTAVKQEFPLADCLFRHDTREVRLPVATLAGQHLEGKAAHNGHSLDWNLDFEGDAPPLLFLPESLYAGPFPKAKSVISRPLLRYHGQFTVDGETHVIDDWHGSESHNWGSKHTDQYAWGQVAGFDDAPDAFLECATARVKVGPLQTPWMTLLTLRLDGKEYRFNSIKQSMKAKGQYEFFDWTLETGDEKTRIEVHIHAPAAYFTALTYFNPPKGSKTCLNSKIARCTVKVTEGGRVRELHSAHGAAFEILTDRKDHGVELAV